MDGARSRSAARRRAGLAAAFGAVTLAVLGYAAFEFAGQVSGHAALKPASPPPTARASQAAATAPAKARYILLWFTRLPPDGAGTYQVFVHQVTIRGQP